MFQISNLSVPKCVPYEFLSAWFKFHVKISTRSVVRNQWRVTKIHPFSLPFSEDEGLRDIGHSMSIGNLILGVNSVTLSYLIHYDSLLQNATDIIAKCGSYFITNCDRSLLQNTSSFITSCYSFIKICEWVLHGCFSVDFMILCRIMFRSKLTLKPAILFQNRWLAHLASNYFRSFLS